MTVAFVLVVTIAAAAATAMSAYSMPIYLPLHTRTQDHTYLVPGIQIGHTAAVYTHVVCCASTCVNALWPPLRRGQRIYLSIYLYATTLSAAQQTNAEAGRRVAAALASPSASTTHTTAVVKYLVPGTW